ncbi:MAG: MFS transporter [Burkholderiales bacterium]|nr:MFS transporter [Burkholderiales bacterium]
MKNKKTTLLMLIMGSMIEYYDFVIYLYFAKAIGKSLIPVDNATANLLITFSIFASTAIFRPLGGIIFGYIGDKFSRKLSFTNSILIMSLSTLSIAFIPNAEHIGVLATILLITLRLVQSFSVGGEIPAGIIMAYEMSNDKQKALNTNIVIAGTNIGIVVASIISSLLIESSENAWRIPFIIGGCIGLISYAIRKKISESNIFIPNQQHQKFNNPIKILFTGYKL